MKLEDIAKKAGVSRSTVSRVINGGKYVSEDTKARVMAVIESERFRPNPAARALVTQRTKVIGVVIPHSLQDIFASDDPYYFLTVIQGIVDTTQQRDYATLLWVSNADEDNQRFYQRILDNRMMDGLIIISSVVSDPTLLEDLIHDDMPFVITGRPSRYEDRISYVNIDNQHAAQQAVQHLFNQGHTKVGTITGNIENVDAQERLEGYRQAHRKMGVPVNEDLIAEGRFSRIWGYMCMKQLINRDVDAVFTASDSIAFGAIEAIQEAGLKIPDDIAIVGFDDIPDAVKSTPPLTTIRQPILQKAIRASELLIDLIEERASNPVQILLPTQLVIRETCGTYQQAAAYNGVND